MNIFVLDRDPAKAARMMCDKHVVKMALESAQMLCNAHPVGTAPYERTHYNHPCSKWARATLDNYRWLLEHARTLCQEYTYRYGRRHKSEDVVEWCFVNEPRVNEYGCDMWRGLTPFVISVPSEYKVEAVVRGVARGVYDPVESYRAYYMGEWIRKFARWTRRKPPKWWKEESDAI